MVNFRFITQTEEKLIQKNINLKFGEGLFKKIKNNYQIMVSEAKRKEIFLVPPQVVEIFKRIKDRLPPNFLGIYFGELSKNQFKIQLTALEFILQYTNKYITVTGKGEQTALYGYNIPLALIKKIDIRVKKGEFVIVQNQFKEAIALGKFLIDSADISAISNPNKIIIKIIIDLGLYLRKEK